MRMGVKKEIKPNWWKRTFSVDRFAKAFFMAVSIGLGVFLGRYFLQYHWLIALGIVTLILMLIGGNFLDVVFAGRKFELKKIIRKRKSKKKTKSNNSKSSKTTSNIDYEPNMGNLFILFSIVSIMLGGLIWTVSHLSQKQRVTQIYEFTNISIFLTLITIVVFVYWLFIVVSIALIFYKKTQEIDSKLKSQLLGLENVVYKSLLYVIFFICIYLITLFVIYIYFINTYMGLILTILIIAASIIGINLGKKLRQKKISKGENRLLYGIYLFGFIVAIISSFSNILIFTSSVDITLDREEYFINESVYLQIYPKGLVPPSIIRVTYSSKQIELFSEKGQDISPIPIYVAIPSENISYKRGDSFITIEMKYFRDNRLSRARIISNPTNKLEEHIPVFNQTRSRT